MPCTPTTEPLAAKRLRLQAFEGLTALKDAIRNAILEDCKQAGVENPQYPEDCAEPGDLPEALLAEFDIGLLEEFMAAYYALDEFEGYYDEDTAHAFEVRVDGMPPMESMTYLRTFPGLKYDSFVKGMQALTVWKSKYLWDLSV